MGVCNLSTSDPG